MSPKDGCTTRTSGVRSLPSNRVRQASEPVASRKGRQAPPADAPLRPTIAGAFLRIFYRDRKAWLDPAEQSAGLEPQEQEAPAIFSAVLPNVPASIDLADGTLSYQLISNGRVDTADEPTMVAEYHWNVDVQSPLPWEPASEAQPKKRRT